MHLRHPVRYTRASLPILVTHTHTHTHMCGRARDTHTCVGVRETHTHVWACERDTHLCGRARETHTCVGVRETHTSITTVAFCPWYQRHSVFLNIPDSYWRGKLLLPLVLRRFEIVTSHRHARSTVAVTARWWRGGALEGREPGGVREE